MEDINPQLLVGKPWTPIDSTPTRIYNLTGPTKDEMIVLVELETICPGVMIYGHVNYSRSWYRLKNLIEQDWFDFKSDSYIDVDYVRVISPKSIDFYVEAWLRRRSEDSRLPQVNVEELANRSWFDRFKPLSQIATREVATEGGRELLQNIPFLKPSVYARIADYQVRVLYYHMVYGLALIMPCGSGKTLTTICAMIGRWQDCINSNSGYDNAIVIICPARARRGWQDEIAKWTELKAYRVRPQGQMRKNDETLEEYMAERLNLRDQPPIVIFGLEVLSDHSETITDLKPIIIVMDEVHRFANHTRWDVRVKETGERVFLPKQTKSQRNSRAVRGYAVMAAVQQKTVRHRLGLTATPQGSGVASTWAMFDLISPKAWGTRHSFCVTYCGGFDGDHGFVANGPPGSVSEYNQRVFKHRASHCVYEIGHSESHAGLPETRVTVAYIEEQQLQAATTGFKVAAARRKAQRGGFEDKEHFVNLVLERNATRKRGWITDKVLTGLENGGKVIVFTYLRDKVEWWAEHLRRAISKVVNTRFNGVTPLIQWGHGGTDPRFRETMGPNFAKHDGASLLIGTRGAFGESVDGFQYANLAIMAALTSDPKTLDQLRGRLDRHGDGVRASELLIPVAEGNDDERVVSMLAPRIQSWQDNWQADQMDGMEGKLLGIETKEQQKQLMDQLFEMFL